MSLAASWWKKRLPPLSKTATTANTLWPFPKRTCHFCLLASVIVPPHKDDPLQGRRPSDLRSTRDVEEHMSIGTTDNWFCSRCECWNRIDGTQEGGMASWESAMSDVSKEASKRQYTTYAEPSPATLFPASSHNQSSFTFCHTCQTNQTLLLAMLANYGEDDAREGESNDESHFDEWKSSLEQRYPPVCQDCQDSVNECLQWADKRARALIWNDLLLKRLRQQRERPDGRLARAHSLPSAKTKEESLKLTFMWYMQAFALLLSWLANVVISFDSQRSMLHEGKLPWAWISLLLFPPACSYFGNFDISLPRSILLIRTMRKKTSRYSFQSAKKESGEALVATIALRLISLYLAGFLMGGAEGANRTSTSHFRWIILIMCAVQFALTMRAFYSVSVVVQHANISLRSRNASLTSTPTKLHRSTNTKLPHHELTDLSLTGHSTALRRRESEHVQADAATANDEGDASENVLDNSMDWSPTPSAGQSGTQHSFVLGPQRFFEPLKHTGLEDLVANKLDLRSTDVEERIQHNEGGTAVASTTNDADGDVIMHAVKENRKKSFRIGGVRVSLFCAALAIAASAVTLYNVHVRSALQRALDHAIMHPIRQWYEQALIRIKIDEDIVDRGNRLPYA